MGLRNVVIAVLVGGIVLAEVLALAHASGMWLILAAYWMLGLVALLLERGRYRPKRTGKRFAPTAERYVDPVSGERIRVYVDTATGERDDRPDGRGSAIAP